MHYEIRILDKIRLIHSDIFSGMKKHKLENGNFVTKLSKSKISQALDFFPWSSLCCLKHCRGLYVPKKLKLFVVSLLCWYIYISKYFLLLIDSLNWCLSIIVLNNFFAIGAAIVLPFPPCSTIILKAYLGCLYGPKATYKAWSLSS